MLVLLHSCLWAGAFFLLNSRLGAPFFFFVESRLWAGVFVIIMLFHNVMQQRSRLPPRRHFNKKTPAPPLARCDFNICDSKKNGAWSLPTMLEIKRAKIIIDSHLVY